MRRKKRLETRALLEVLEPGTRKVESSKTKPVRAAFADDLRHRKRERARAALLARLKRERVVRTKHWTRNEIYDGR